MNGCLIVHGLTSSPGVMNPVREVLDGEGYHVEAPLLAGHGGTVEDIAKTTWHDWYGSLRKAYERLRCETDRIYYVGLSMGALLGLKLAAEKGWGVRAMALISAPIKLTRLDYAKYLVASYTPLRWVIDSVPKDFDKSVMMPEGRKRYSELAMDRMPLAGVRQFVRLQRQVRNNLRKVTSPILMIQGGHDNIAPPWNAGIIEKGISSDVVDIVNYSRSGHIVPLDWDGQEMALQIAEFFRRFA